MGPTADSDEDAPMTVSIRLARETDAEQTLAIYTPIVREAAISFELEPPTREQLQARIATTLERTPWLVCASNGDIMGYCYAGPYRSRGAYQWSVEVTVYTSANHRRMGVARAVYASLFECLKLLGYVSAYAGIALPNPASIALHEGLGFRPVGVYHNAGHKLGGWHDVGWWELAIQDPPSAPEAPALLPAIADSSAWRQALEAGERWLVRAG